MRILNVHVNILKNKIHLSNDEKLNMNNYKKVIAVTMQKNKYL